MQEWEERALEQQAAKNNGIQLGMQLIKNCWQIIDLMIWRERCRMMSSVNNYYISIIWMNKKNCLKKTDSCQEIIKVSHVDPAF